MPDSRKFIGQLSETSQFHLSTNKSSDLVHVAQQIHKSTINYKLQMEMCCILHNSNFQIKIMFFYIFNPVYLQLCQAHPR